MAWIYRASGDAVRIAPTKGGRFTLDEMQAIVGGWIEIVKIRDGCVMVLNEDGRSLQLPANPKATRLYYGVRETFPPLVGDVLVCTRHEAGDNEETDT